MKMRSLFLFSCVMLVNIYYSQEDSIANIQNFHQFETDRDAKYAVFKIVQYSGLLPNFRVIEDKEIKNAIAFIKNKKRYIKYNPDFRKRVNDSTQTDWAAISTLFFFQINKNR